MHACWGAERVRWRARSAPVGGPTAPPTLLTLTHAPTHLPTMQHLVDHLPPLFWWVVASVCVCEHACACVRACVLTRPSALPPTHTRCPLTPPHPSLAPPVWGCVLVCLAGGMIHKWRSALVRPQRVWVGGWVWWAGGWVGGWVGGWEAGEAGHTHPHARTHSMSAHTPWHAQVGLLAVTTVLLMDTGEGEQRV